MDMSKREPSASQEAGLSGTQAWFVSLSDWLQWCLVCAVVFPCGHLSTSVWRRLLWIMDPTYATRGGQKVVTEDTCWCVLGSLRPCMLGFNSELCILSWKGPQKQSGQALTGTGIGETHIGPFSFPGQGGTLSQLHPGPSFANCPDDRPALGLSFGTK